MNNLHLSLKNSKLGEVPNFNLPPVKTCPNCKFCAKKCYALKAYKQYPEVKNAWDENLEFLLNCEKNGDYSPFVSWMVAELNKAYSGRSKRAGLRLFRVHSAGDFFSQAYLDAWLQVMRAVPDIRFLAFTKSFHLTFANVPENAQFVFSSFPGMEMPKDSQFPTAYAVEDGDVVPEDAVPCGGHCDTCGVCWGLGKMGKAVCFAMH